MIDTNYRKVFQPVFDKTSHLVIKTGLTPNHVTVLAFVVGVISALFIANGEYIIACALLLLSGLLDILDGTVARVTNKSSYVGAFLDMVFDRLVEASVIIGFYFIKPELSLLYLLFLVSVIFNFSTFSLAGALIKNKGSKSMHYDVGLIERSETFICFVLMLILPQWAGYFLGALTCLIFVTGILRSIRIIKILQE